MRFIPTNQGRHRLLDGDLAHGLYCIVIYCDHDGPVFDATGKPLGTLMMVMRDPPPAPPKVHNAEQKQRIAERRAVCDACEHQGGYGQATVRCARCNRCGGKLSMLAAHEVCPLGLWPDP